MKKLFLFLSLAIYMAACAKVILPTATETDAQRATEKWPGTTLAELSEGKLLYEEKCAKCHKLYDPKSESEAGWNKVVPVMARKAKIDARTENLILKYVVTMSNEGK